MASRSQTKPRTNSYCVLSGQWPEAMPLTSKVAVSRHQVKMVTPVPARPSQRLPVDAYRV